MAFYYVKSGGTATGDAGRTTTARTGAFGAASTYYDEVGDVFSVPTTNFADGDFILVSHLHARSSNQAISYSWNDATTASYLVSVDDSNQDTPKKGASEISTSNTADLTLVSTGCFIYCYGMEWKTGDNMYLGHTQSRATFDECLFESDASGDISAYMGLGDGGYLELNNCVFKTGNAGGLPIWVVGNQHLVIRGGSIDGTGTSPNTLFDNIGGSSTVWMEGFDATNLSATGDLVGTTGHQSSDEVINFRAVGCKIPSGASIFDATIDVAGGNRVYEFIGVDNADQYRYLYKSNLGTVIQEKTTVVTASTPFEGSQKLSFKIDTATACSPASPFIWPFPYKYADMSAAGSDRALLYVTSDSDPLDDELQVILGWPDSTDDVLYKYGNSGQVAESGVWVPKRFNTTGASYTTASVWTSGKTNERQLPVTASSADATSPFPPRAWLLVMKSTGANSIYVNSELVFD